MATPAKILALEVRKGERVLELAPLRRPLTTIGRLNLNHVILNNVSVSREHAQIEAEGGSLFVVDRGAPNGVLLDGRRVERAELARGSEISIGIYTLVLREVDPADLSEGATRQAFAGAVMGSTFEIAPDPSRRAAPPPEAPAAPAPIWSVEHRGLGGRGDVARRLVPDRPLLVGRAKHCDLVLEDLLVSREHCRLRPEGAELHLEDLGSRDGTRVNGAAVERAVLQAGDVVAVGDHELRIVRDDRRSGPG